MPRFEPKNPDYRAVAAATFDRQQAMRTLGISISRLVAGEVDLSMGYAPAWTQQNGFVHAGIITAGLDTACGIAAFTLMAPGCDILTVQFKTNLLAPANGERFAFRAHVAWPHADGVRGERLRASWRLRNADRDHDRHADGVGAPRVLAPPMAAIMTSAQWHHCANNDGAPANREGAALQC